MPSGLEILGTGHLGFPDGVSFTFKGEMLSLRPSLMDRSPRSVSWALPVDAGPEGIEPRLDIAMVDRLLYQ